MSCFVSYLGSTVPWHPSQNKSLAPFALKQERKFKYLKETPSISQTWGPLNPMNVGGLFAWLPKLAKMGSWTLPQYLAGKLSFPHLFCPPKTLVISKLEPQKGTLRIFIGLQKGPFGYPSTLLIKGQNLLVRKNLGKKRIYLLGLSIRGKLALREHILVLENVPQGSIFCVLGHILEL